MAEQKDDRTAADRQGTTGAEQPTGGSVSRGPEFGTGGEPDAPLPPYDDARGEGGENTAVKAFDASNAPEPGARTPESDEERKGVSGTEVEPEPALGVGKTRTSGAEQQAPDRSTETQGAGRPAGAVEGGESDASGARQ